MVERLVGNLKSREISGARTISASNQGSPGISLNINKRSVSASFGGRGSHLTVGPKGTRTTVGIPGTGLYYTDYQCSQPAGFLVLAIVIIVLLGVLLRLA
jgi:hypothetical protein